MVALKNIQKDRSKEKQLQSTAALKDKANNADQPTSGSAVKMDFKDLYILCKLG